MVKKMTRLINADELLKKAEDIEMIDMWHMRYQAAVVYVNDIESAPTIDAVPVVRCKDCKLHGTNGDRLNCAIFCCTMPDDAFCSCGERRDER